MANEVNGKPAPSNAANVAWIEHFKALGRGTKKPGKPTPVNGK